MNGNWIYQTTTTTGTGKLALTAVSGYPTIASQFAQSVPVKYQILDNATGAPIEQGIGVIDGVGDLVRQTVHATMVGSTYTGVNATAVNLSAGTKRVIISLGAGSSMCTQHAINSGATLIGFGDMHPSTSVTTNNVFTRDTGYFLPYKNMIDAPIHGFGFRLGSTLVASTTAKFGVYTIGTNGRPDVLIAETTAVSVASAAGDTKKSLFSAPLRLPPNFFACLLITGNGDIGMQSVSGAFSPIGAQGFDSSMLAITHFTASGMTGGTFTNAPTVSNQSYVVQRPLTVALTAP